MISLRNRETGKWGASIHHRWNVHSDTAAWQLIYEISWQDTFLGCTRWSNHKRGLSKFRLLIRKACICNPNLIKEILVHDWESRIDTPLIEWLPTRTRNMIYAGLDPVQILQLKRDAANV